MKFGPLLASPKKDKSGKEKKERSTRYTYCYSKHACWVLAPQDKVYAGARTCPFNPVCPSGNQILMTLVYNISSVAPPDAKLAMLDFLATLAMLTWLFEELQKKYYILKSSEFDFLRGGQG